MSNNDVLLLSMIPIPFILINSSNKIHLKQLLIDPIWSIQLILAILLTVITIWFYKVYDTSGQDTNTTYIKIRKKSVRCLVSLYGCIVFRISFIVSAILDSVCKYIIISRRIIRG